MSTQKNVGWVRPEAVTHQDQPTGQNEWQVLPIEQVADVNPRIDKSAIPDDLPVSFVPMPAVGAGDGSIHVDETRPAGEVKKGFTPFLEGDVLFAKITPCMENGKMAVVPKLVNGYGFGSTEFHVLRPKAGIEAKYLYYYVSSQSFRGEAERYMTGAVGQKRVSTTYLKEAKIPVAPLNQQKRIVAEIEKQFSRLDEAVTNLKRVKANLKRYKAAVLKAAVEGRLVETEAELARREGRSYETGEQLLQRILEIRSQWKGKGKYKEPVAPDTTDLPELPEGWTSAPVDAVCEIVDGDRGSEYPKKSDFKEAGYCLFLSTANVRPNGFLFEEMQFIDKDKHERLRKGKLDRGDIVFTSRGTIGNIAYYGEDIPYECVRINSGMFILRGFSDLLNEKYFEWYLRSPAIKRQIDQLKSGTAQPQLPIREFRTFTVTFPEKREQAEIVEEIERRFSLVEEVEAQVDANRTRADRLRQAILSSAFEGRLVVGASRRVVEAMTSAKAVQC